MPKQQRPWMLTSTLALTLALAGCVVTPGTLVKPTGTDATTSTTKQTSKKAAILKEKPQAGDARALENLKANGRVQIAFKGLSPSRARAPVPAQGFEGGKMMSNAGATATARQLRHLLQTTAEIDRVEITLTGPKGYARTQSLSRGQLMQPMVTMFFDAVPVGDATLEARVYDVSGATIGSSQSAFPVSRGAVTEVALNVKLQATGGVSATIGFEDADVEDANITGYWVVGTGGTPPDYPMSGCGEGYVWFVTQYGDSVRATVSGYNDESSADAAHRGMYWSEEAFGTVHRNKVVMTGRVTYTDEAGNMVAKPEEASYVLQFDPATWRMSGERNGQPGWAVPYIYDCSGPATPPPLYPSPPPYLPYPMPSAVPPTPWVGPMPYPTGGPYPVPIVSEAPRVPTQVTGQVFDDDGNPVRGGTVDFYTWETGESFGALIGPDGTYALVLPTGLNLEYNAYSNDGRHAGNGFTMFYDFGGSNTETFNIWLNPTWSDPSCVAVSNGMGGSSMRCAEDPASPVPSIAPSWYPAPTPSAWMGTPPPTWYPTPAPSAWMGSPLPAWTPTPAPSAWYPTPAPSAWPGTPSPAPSAAVR